MSAEVLKEFLYTIGYKEVGRDKFLGGIEQAAVGIAKFAAKAEAAAGIVVYAVAKIASAMEDLYYMSVRTNSAVENIQAYSYAISQMGGSAAGAKTSLEALGAFIRTKPGAVNMLQNMGVETTDTNGKLKDTTQLLEGLGKRLAAMPYFQANAYASFMGIDEKTLMALREGIGDFEADYHKMAKAAGIDSQQAAKDSRDFMRELRGLGAAVEILERKVATSLARHVGDDLHRLKTFFVDNFDKIAKVLEVVARGILFAADIFTRLAIRVGQAIGEVLDWFNNLDGGTKRMVEGILGVVAVWKILNTAFAASPIGRVIMLATGLALLYDDYKTWKEGGKSLIDWEQWEPSIQAAIKGINEIWQAVKQLGGAIFGEDGSLAQSFKELVPVLEKTFLHVLDLVADALRMIASLIRGDWASAWSDAKKYISDYIDMLKDLEKYIEDHLPEGLKKAWGWTKNTVADAASTARDGLDWGRQKLAQVTGQDWIASGIPTGGNPNDARGIRNNNPGNLRQWSTAAGSDGSFAVFKTAQDGINAMADNLRSYGRKGFDTIRTIINRWAPSKENNTAAYITAMTKGMGVDADAKLNMNDPTTLIGLMKGITQHENGSNPYNYDQFFNAATRNYQQPLGPRVAANSNGVQISQNNTFNVTGAADPTSTADRVMRAQDQAGAGLVRNVQGAVR